MHSFALQHHSQLSVGTHNQLQQSNLVPRTGITPHQPPHSGVIPHQCPQLNISHSQAPQSDASSLQPHRSHGTHTEMNSEPLASDVQHTVSSALFLDSTDDVTASKYVFRAEITERDRLQGMMPLIYAF